MRQQAQTAELIVVNHHLYFADASLRWRLGEGALAVLPPHEAVIFDEAHEVEEIACQHFGVHVSEARLDELVRDVERFAVEQKLSAALAQLGLDELRAAARTFFAALGPVASRRLLALSLADALRTPYARLEDALAHLEAALLAQAEEQATQLARRAGAFGHDLGFVMRRPLPSTLAYEATDAPTDTEAYVRYVEPHGRGVALVARPLEVALRLQQAILGRAAVFVSATLTVDQKFDYFRTRLGLDAARELRVDSPFDFGTHSAIYIADDLPAVDDPQFPALAAERAAALVTAAGGGAFVLCTSHRSLPVMREALTRERHMRVLMQGERPRSTLLAEFAGDGHAVLVATMSFWQGVDIPGSALRLVIIDRLPFASPADPLVAGRIDYLRSLGVEPFRAYQLPQAVLLLRQGFGRLLRTQRDRGLVAVLDRRLVGRSYGSLFLRSLPSCPRLHTLADAQAYLATVHPDAASHANV